MSGGPPDESPEPDYVCAVIRAAGGHGDHIAGRLLDTSSKTAHVELVAVGGGPARQASAAVMLARMSCAILGDRDALEGPSRVDVGDELVADALERWARKMLLIVARARAAREG